MVALSKKLIKEWEHREGPAIFTTVNDDGIPSATYVSCVRFFDNETLVVADNYFHKTRANIFPVVRSHFYTEPYSGILTRSKVMSNIIPKVRFLRI